MNTSKLYQERVKSVVPQAISDLKSGLEARDFQKIAPVIISESDSLHACCADSDPPIIYVNETTKAIHRLVREVNSEAGRHVMAYTCDAGANCFIISELENLGSIISGF